MPIISILMTSQHLETFPEVEFTPENAGERAGWVDIVRQDNDLVSASIAVATVGDEGAMLGVERNTSTNARTDYGTPVCRGFLQVSGIKAIIDLSGEEERILSNRAIKTGDTAMGKIEPKDILWGYWLGENQVLDRTWAAGDQNLLGLIKQGLDEHEATECYPDLYYLINGHVGSSYPIDDEDRELENVRESLFLPDPEMSSTTFEQADIAISTLTALEEADVHDRTMLDNLTVFSDIAPEQISGVFKSSRLVIAGLEKRVKSSRDSLMGSYIYLGDGRTFPYMDPAKEDPKISFGRELEALKNRDIGPAQAELRKERRELEHRVNHARQGLDILRDLLKAESEV